MMVNRHCQLNETWNYAGHECLGMPVGCYLDWVNPCGKTQSAVGGTIPWAGILNYIKRGNQVEHKHVSPSAS